ncbi:MAG: hypothetical protein PVH84_02480 [Candidatus Aminicenantes bacterium]|jgi:hypothetical protein
MKKRVQQEVDELFAKEKDTVITRKITEEDLKGLPEPVQKYLRFTQIIGKDRVRTARLKQKGFFRTKPDQKWMPLRAEEYFTVDAPGFLWYGKMRMFPFITVSGIDKFSGGKGSLVIKLLSVIKVVDAKGEEYDQAELMRYLNEMVWFPSAFLSDYIHWEAVNAESARATIVAGDLSATALLSFNQEGQIKNFVAERYMDMNGVPILKKWSTPFKEYAEVNGIMVPVQGEGVWKLSTGDFTYVKITGIPVLEYNNPNMF